MSSKFLAAQLLFATLTYAQAPQLYEAVETHMGTLFRIKLYADNEQTAKAGFQAAFKRIEQLDNLLSDYKPDSELNLAAQAAVSHPVAISDDLFRVLKESQQVSSETDGAFDITVGPLTRLWRAARRKQQLPSSELIEEARDKCNYRWLHLDESQKTLTLDKAGMQLDLGGIAKGYAADEALLVMAKLGLNRALVAASGDLAFGDPPPDQPGWKVGVDSFDRADKPFTKVLMLSNAAISTSGSTEQFLEIEDKHFSHIIDPKTGMGLITDITVTTIARHGILADPAATAVSVLGRKKGLAFIERHPELEALILEKFGGRTSVFESKNFKTSEHALN